MQSTQKHGSSAGRKKSILHVYCTYLYKYIYLHNNPICTNGWLDENENAREMIEKSGTLESGAAGCKAQCSIYCQDRYLGNDVCGRGCNFKACKFDGGDCTQ